MTLDSKLSKAVYHGNGSTTVFPFAFKVWETSQIAVTMTDASGVSTDVTSNSTVTVTSSGGSVTYPASGSPLATGAKLAITRNMPFTQGINLVSASRFDPQVLEDGLDQATAERQQMLEMMARAVILPATSNESPQDVVAAIYASRDAASASASEASTSATAAAASEAAAAASAAAAEAAIPDNLVDRVTATETINTAQDTRLTDIEAVTALVTVTPGAGKIPKADANGKLASWVDPVAAITGSFKNLKANASGTSVNINVTVDELIVKNSSNIYLTLRNLSLTWNAAGVGVANGIDTASITANTWYCVHVIHNPTTSTTALLISLSPTAPTLPSGYTYFARVGAIKWGISYPLKFTQAGDKVEYDPAAGTNVTEFPTMASGALGTWTSSAYSPVAVSVSPFVPPTAAEIDFFGWNGGGGVAMAAGMNAVGGGWAASTCPPFHNLANNSATLMMNCSGILRSSNIYVATAATGPVFKCKGWRDSL